MNNSFHGDVPSISIRDLKEELRECYGLISIEEIMENTELIQCIESLESFLSQITV